MTMSQMTRDGKEVHRVEILKGIKAIELLYMFIGLLRCSHLHQDIRRKHSVIKGKELTAVALAKGVSFHGVEQQAHCPEVVRTLTLAESSLQLEQQSLFWIVEA
jgi:hypothetical protein